MESVMHNVIAAINRRGLAVYACRVERFAGEPVCEPLGWIAWSNKPSRSRIARAFRPLRANEWIKCEDVVPSQCDISRVTKGTRCGRYRLFGGLL